METTRGNTTVWVIVILVIIIIGGLWYFNTQNTVKQPQVDEPAAQTDSIGADESKASKEENVGTSTPGDEDANDAPSVSYIGERIAGASSPLLEFNEVDFAVAQGEGKLVMLYFYANWCPSCKIEFQSTKSAFDELERDDVVAFRVHFKDNDTTDAHEALAKEHNVITQHTKVFIKDGEQVLKAPDTWNKARYLEEINKEA